MRTIALALLALALAAAAVAAPPKTATDPRYDVVDHTALPLAPIPAHGVLIHLKVGACAQVASATTKTIAAGGKGVVFLRDARDKTMPWAGNQGFDFLTKPVPGFPPGRIFDARWVRQTYTTAGSFTYYFASADCPIPALGLWKPAAATVTIKVTR